MQEKPDGLQAPIWGAPREGNNAQRSTLNSQRPILTLLIERWALNSVPSQSADPRAYFVSSRTTPVHSRSSSDFSSSTIFLR